LKSAKYRHKMSKKMVVFNGRFTRSEISEKRAYISELLALQTLDLANSLRLPLYAENTELLNQLATATARFPEIRSVVISTSDNRVLIHIPGPDTAAATDVFRKTVEVHSSPLGYSPTAALGGEQPRQGSFIGRVTVERGAADLNHMIRSLVSLPCSTAVGFWLTISFCCYLALRKVTRSFNSLVSGIDTMQSGDFSSRITVQSDDEAGRAARAVNDLACTLQLRSEENSRLQEEALIHERQMLHAQKLESLGGMAGGIALDFNNLLQSILGNMELAKMKLDPDSAPLKFIVRAMTSAHRAALLSQSMLTYSGKGYIARKVLNLNELVRVNVAILQLATSVAVKLELHLSAELPSILADEAHIQQVVMNLITNASESVEQQSGVIVLTTGTLIYDHASLGATVLTHVPAAGCYVFLEVKDNGCGMSTETLQRLFDPFFTTKFTGRGLGMSAVSGIMNSHLGALFVESSPGNGTTFRALFPIAETTPPSLVTALAVPLHAKGTFSEEALPGLVLVVDDEHSVQMVCTEMVKHYGFSVVTACDGVDAVAKFREHADDIVIVLMDVTMPNMDGIAAMNEIYRIKPDTKIIISSGFNKDELSTRIIGQAPAGFIRKPYSLDVLEAEMRRVVQADWK
jgi:signal transduction histidine kinase/CheY-like chemotaxis protein